MDPREVRSNRQRFRRDVIPALERVNSFYCPTGRWPSRGWILLPKFEYDQINHYSTALQLNIGDTTDPNNVSALNNLSIVQAQCVTRGLASDPNSLYLIELTDTRGILYNKWFQFPATSQYNIRAQAYPQTFQLLSTNSGTPWTWVTMLQDMWNKMPLLGAWPGLPTAPTGTPEGFWFTGVPAWTALCDVLEYLGLTVTCDLTKSAPFTIVQLGAADAAFTALSAKYLTNKEDDLDWIDVGAGRVPETVIILFRRRNQYYGTEEAIRDDALQWDTSAVYSVTVNAPAFFNGAVGTNYLWCDFTVRYDQDNNPLGADVTVASAIAQERVTEYFAKVYRQTAGYMTKTYAGALPFTTGSQVDGVCYYQDYRNDDEAGWRTQIVRGPYPAWSDLWDKE